MAKLSMTFSSGKEANEQENNNVSNQSAKLSLKQTIQHSENSNNQQITSSNSKEQTTSQEKELSDDKLKKINEKFAQMREKMDELEGQKVTLERKLNSSLPLQMLVNETIKEPENNSKALTNIINTLNEGITNADQSIFSVFLIRFAKAWILLRSCLDNLSDDQQQNLEKVHNSLTKLLGLISGCYVSQRRMLLDFVAHFCNEYFSDYDFISPEQTLNVDPEIHNATGLGSSTIKEGVSFAVVRRSTKKTVKYADIKV